MTPTEVEDLYRLLAIAKYEDRYVIPQAHTEYAGHMVEQQGMRGYNVEGGVGGCDMIPPRKRPERADNSRFMMLKMAPPGASARASAPDGAASPGRPTQGHATSARTSDDGT